MQQIDAWLDTELGAFISTVQQAQDDREATEVFNDTKRAIKDKILESYLNGQEHGKSRKPARSGGVKDFASEAWRQVRPARKRQSSTPRR